MNIIKKTVSAALSFRNKLSWACSTYYFKKKSIKSNIDTAFPGGTKIILIPHADDEWIGCSTIIRTYNDVLLCDMDMDGGDSKSLHAVRKNELQSIAELYKKEIICIFEDKVNHLLEIIELKKPAYIFLPYYVDWHKEHIMVMDLLEEVLSQYASDVFICMYQVSLPIADSQITHVLPMSKKSFLEKWDTFMRVYKSQTHLPIGRFGAHEKIAGALTNSFSAEVFCVKTKLEWLNQKNKWLLTEEEKKECFTAINDIRKIRDMIINITDRRL